ncbi:hypothetical protein H8356DRAFT_131597 [Neocallimastix lanati (nom. inval.)]|nr:hypothetical protein H8356DRAFT_131597 [Neocallimastix sp. JGI-2020a]
MLFLMIFSTLNNKEKVNAHHKYSDVCQTIDDYLKAKRFRKYLSKKKKKKKKDKNIIIPLKVCILNNEDEVSELYFIKEMIWKLLREVYLIIQ